MGKLWLREIQNGIKSYKLSGKEKNQTSSRMCCVHGCSPPTLITPALPGEVGTEQSRGRLTPLDAHAVPSGAQQMVPWVGTYFRWAPDLRLPVWFPIVSPNPPTERFLKNCSMRKHVLLSQVETREQR